MQRFHFLLFLPEVDRGQSVEVVDDWERKYRGNSKDEYDLESFFPNSGINSTPFIGSCVCVLQDKLGIRMKKNEATRDEK